MIVVDTGILYAAADEDDRHHQAAVGLLERNPPDALLVPTPAIVECSWLLESRLGPSAEAEFLHSINSGELTRLDLVDEDWARAVELVRTYADLYLGVVDASIVAVAERLGISTIATTNHRDFRVVRPRHCDAFDLVP